MRTVKSMIEGALREIVALEEGETASADMIEDGLLIFSELLQSWSDEGLMVPYLVTETLIGDNTKASYIWGPGGDIPTMAPVDVVAVSFILENGQTPLVRADARLFIGRPWLGIVAMPQYFFYERGLTNYLRFDVAPYGGGFQIVSQKPLDSTLVLTADLEFPESYSRMIRTNLAIEFCPPYQKTASAELVAVAASSKKIVKRKNSGPIPSMTTDLPGTINPSTSLPLTTT